MLCSQLSLIHVVHVVNWVPSRACASPSICYPIGTRLSVILAAAVIVKMVTRARQTRKKRGQITMGYGRVG